MNELSQEDRELKAARNKHILHVFLFSIWTFGTGAVTWAGGVAQERLKSQEALIVALYEEKQQAAKLFQEESEQKAKLYGLVDVSKAEAVAICRNLKGKNCDQVLQ